MRHLRSTGVSIRAYQPQDLGRILDLWARAGVLGGDADGWTVDQAVGLMSAPGAVALVAEADGELAGMACGAVSSIVGWVHRLAVSPGASPDVAEALLEHLEMALVEHGARRIVSAARRDAPAEALLERRGYHADARMAVLARDAPAPRPAGDERAVVSGELVDPGLWEQLKGLEEAKQIIERRVILPLAEPALAARHAVAPPRAIVLFGPPGTGKTTFARGIASRLGWAFVEIQPAELAGEGPERQAKLLATAFDQIVAMPSAVAFVDEVEDLASIRHEQRRVTPSVTNEFLKQIPRFRQAVQHLLVCATNWVGRLDHAFLRPGRFDYVLPVGPPDAEARAAIWSRYVGEITDEPVDVGALVAASELFTPADIEFAARKAAQHAFEREHFEAVSRRATTDDFLAAIAATRPSLSAELIAGFAEDAQRFARD